MKPTILVTGGAGYIGSHTSFYLAQQGYNVIVLDTLRHKQTLHPSSFVFAQELSRTSSDKDKIKVLDKDFSDQATLAEIFSTYNVQAVMHFAALIEVGESVKHPFAFYENNVIKTIKLLQTMIAYNVKQFVFSSSCAVYGTPDIVPIPENHPKNPISPYGKNKLMVEMCLEDCARAYGLQFISLRYFNAAGALDQEGLGEQHDPETHLIPLALKAAHENRPFYLFGDNYDTPDGSCVRDFLHVQDLASAHAQALHYLQKTKKSEFFNLGTGTGYSVKQVIAAIEKECGKKIAVQVKPRREGDPAKLIANPTKAKTMLQWQPCHSSLENIVASAHRFYTNFYLNEKLPLDSFDTLL